LRETVDVSGDTRLSRRIAAALGYQELGTQISFSLDQRRQ
jgi:hypothetical protein